MNDVPIQADYVGYATIWDKRVAPNFASQLSRQEKLLFVSERSGVPIQQLDTYADESLNAFVEKFRRSKKLT